MLLKTLLGLVFVAAAGYAGICGWMYAKQRELIYFPQVTRVAAELTDFDVIGNGITLKGWRVNPGRQNAIIYYGGNAESIEAMRDEFARWFPDSSSYFLSYRGYGASEGSPDEQSLFADALLVFDRVQAQHRGAPVAVIGRSLGSGVASYVASQRPVAKLALVTPFDSLASVAQTHYPWLPVRWLVKDRYESIRYLPKYQGPVLVVRAGRDQVIPATHTERLISALSRSPRIVHLLEADHGSIDADPAYGAALTEFMQ